jgi:hypothetical protein
VDLPSSLAWAFSENNPKVKAAAVTKNLYMLISKPPLCPAWIETDITDAVRKSPTNDAILARTAAGVGGNQKE